MPLLLSAQVPNNSRDHDSERSISSVIALAERKRAESIQAEIENLKKSIASNRNSKDFQTKYVYTTLEWYLKYLALEQFAKEHCADDVFTREWTNRDIEHRFFRGIWFFAQLSSGTSRCGEEVEIKSEVLRQVADLVLVAKGIIELGKGADHLLRWRSDEKLLNEDKIRLQRISIDPQFGFDAAEGAFHKKLVLFLLTGDGIIAPPIALEPLYVDQIPKLLESGIVEIRETKDTDYNNAPEYLKFSAQVFIHLKQPENAIQKYQEILTHYPLAKSFSEVKAQLEFIMKAPSVLRPSSRREPVID